MFFQTFFQTMSPGVDYNLTVSKTETRLTVLVMPKVNELKDAAQAHLVPFSMCGTPDEIDRGFFAAIGQPLQRSAGLLTNMAQYEKQADKAAANSKVTKDAKSKEDKETKDKKEKYDKHLKKAGEQEAAKDHAGALQSLQQARLHADEKQIKTVDEKIAEMKAAMSQGSLFGAEVVQMAPAQQTEQSAMPQATPQPQQAAPAPQEMPAYPQQPAQQQVPPQQMQGFPGMFGGQPGQPQPPQYPQQYMQQAPQGYYQQGTPPAQFGGIHPDPGFLPAEPVFNPADYAGIPDVQATHVGAMMSNPQ